MRKIRISTCSYDAKLNVYTVYTGNSCLFRFKNKKAAQKFLVDTSEFLTEQLHEVRMIYADILRADAQLWIYIDTKQLGSFDLVQGAKKRQELMEATQKQCNLATERSHWDNGNTFAFHQIRKAAENLYKCAQLIWQIADYKNIPHIKNEMSVQKKRAQTVELNLHTYKKLKADDIIRDDEQMTEEEKEMANLSQLRRIK